MTVLIIFGPSLSTLTLSLFHKEGAERVELEEAEGGEEAEEAEEARKRIRSKRSHGQFCLASKLQIRLRSLTRASSVKKCT